MSGDRRAIAEWKTDVIAENAGFQPKEWGPVPSPTWPAPCPPTTYGTQTGYVLETSILHTWQPVGAPGQGYRPTHFQQPYAPEPTSGVPVPSNATSNSTSESGGIRYHKVWRQQQSEFQESDQMADWGYWYYATKNTQGLTYQSGADHDVRGQFLNYSHLANSQDNNYRAINDIYPVFGFGVDLGPISNSSVSTLFQLSLHQHDCIQFECAQGNQSVPCLWTSYLSNDTLAVSRGES